MMSHKHLWALTPMSLAIAASLQQQVIAAEAHQHGLDSGMHKVEELVITGVRTQSPLQLVTNPKKPRQPLPAHDGADYLKTIPGFSVIRKGGTDGDPVLRGMAGSRLSMLMDGGLILGGCNNRMDPPTAYIFPETFDQVRVIKGPQSVQYGPGNSAGVVLFERNSQRPQTAGWKLHSSVLAGSFGRQDGVLDLQYQSPLWELRASGSNSSADDFKDGEGTRINSAYQRWNTQLSLAWTPDDDTRLEFSTARSDGEAAYADRAVDGSKFARENYSLKFNRDNLGNLLADFEFQAYYNYVDHVMDNFSLRQPSGMMANPSAMNPDRTTTGGKAALGLTPLSSLVIDIGIDVQSNHHTSRNSMDQLAVPFTSLPRLADTKFEQGGLFVEADWSLNDTSRIISGLRVDQWRFTDKRQSIALNMMSSVANPQAEFRREDTLHSAFVRFEHGFTPGSTWYVGVGRNERFPDYWELTKESANSLLATDSLQAERNTQLDTGLLFKSETLEASVSFFYSDISDYIMIQSNVMKPAVMNISGMGSMLMPAMRSTTIARNIDARSWGVEFDGVYRFADNWRTEFSLATVRGANDTDGTTLAQLPPLEGRLGLYYDNQRWSAGLMWRALASQNRVDVGKGNIVGQDFGPTSSANILSLNTGWRVTDTVQLTAGIDNLLDETYAEHISRAGAMIPGFDQVFRINEPGRIFWMKAQYSF
jgi:iron complex outermembrane recepter protein